MAGWRPLSPTAAQTSQLLVEPPWIPAVQWDWVTLSCQGSETAGATTWYKDEQQWWKEGPNNFAVNRSGTYQCYRPGSGFSPLVRVLNVAAGVVVSLLFLAQLMGIIVAFHWWHRLGG
ncbi:hypothetical protein HGM15179_021723 [Zosterops borbonicus]|uniref:Ig-like domain-containing protein n=1 Tax=Zosterops borbonicus TaxID=364589 RepID=A0A8K1D3X2_9PASS|nr:hypothetical protein HGM15179_021723 [Zosterops borbonicus]